MTVQRYYEKFNYANYFFLSTIYTHFANFFIGTGSYFKNFV